MYLADSQEVCPWPSRNSHSGAPSTAEEDRRGHHDHRGEPHALGEVLADREYRRSLACPLIRGSSALMTEMPTIAYGSWKSW